MKAILSCTNDDLYLFNLPFAIHSWNKLGVECIVFVPCAENVDDLMRPRRMLLMKLKLMNRLQFEFYCFDAPPDKRPTYAQCIRLYAAGLPELKNDELLVTADADMCVFNQEYWERLGYSGVINIVGADLVPSGQVPMCYISMPVPGWRAVMKINGRSPQQCVDDLLGGIETENFRGNYWAKDQEEAYVHIFSSGLPILCHNRAVAPGVQFATRRADRDGWQVNPNIIDAHLPRPGYLPENFERIYSLFETIYPNDDHRWMREYRDEYVKYI